jgi:cholest-4-en-3-one 26-monooxygenase
LYQLLTLEYPQVRSALPSSFRDNVIQNDPPRHTEIRRLVGAAFTPRMMARFSDWITDQVKVILDGLTGRAACDLVPLVAAELPAESRRRRAPRSPVAGSRNSPTNSCA